MFCRLHTQSNPVGTCTYLGTQYTIIAERLGARLLILQWVFSVGGVWCHTSGMQFVTLTNAIKDVACVQTSVSFRNVIKTSCLQKVYTLCKFNVLSTVAALAVSLSQCQNGQSCNGSEEERAKSLARKRRRRQSVNSASMPWSPRWERWVQERSAAPSEANKARGRLDKRPCLHVLCGSKTCSHSRTLSM